MKTYRSKIGAAIALPAVGIIAGVAALMAYERIWPGFVLMLLLTAFVTHMMLTTRYTIQGNVLTIRCGFFMMRAIPIGAIKSIQETRTMISAPAASLDRLLIAYNKYDIMIVSPKEKAAFIEHLKAINPAIHVGTGR